MRAVGDGAVETWVAHALVRRVDNVAGLAELTGVAAEAAHTVAHLHPIVREASAILQIVAEIAEQALGLVAGRTARGASGKGGAADTCAVGSHIESGIAGGTDIGLIAVQAVRHITSHRLAVRLRGSNVNLQHEVIVAEATEVGERTHLTVIHIAGVADHTLC